MNFSEEKYSGENVTDYLQYPMFSTLDEERQHNKQRLAGAFRLFARSVLQKAWQGHHQHAG